MEIGLTGIGLSKLQFIVMQRCALKLCLFCKILNYEPNYFQLNQKSHIQLHNLMLIVKLFGLNIHAFHLSKLHALKKHTAFYNVEKNHDTEKNKELLFLR